MSTITVPLSEERLERLREMASGLKVSPEELAGARLEEWLMGPDVSFKAAADYVMRKNAELYRRLA